MNNTENSIPIPDEAPVPTEDSVASELSMEDNRDSAAVCGIIRSKSDLGETPAFMFLGKKEADLLRGHLATAFGEESVATIKGTYYMGLDVVTVDRPSFFATAGRKAVRTLQDPIARRPAWRDRETNALWRFRI